MILPFSKQRKSVWNLRDYLEDIERVSNEHDPFFFEVTVKDLYPKLQPYGVIMPAIDPFVHEWHRFFLKLLARDVREGIFNLNRWNHQVIRNERHNRRKSGG